MRLYVVFSDNTDRLSEYLSAKYEIAGTDRTLDAAVAAALRLDPRPDVFLILGTALASTLVDGKVNWGLALLRNLTELRRACPKSRLVVVLPEAASDSLAREIVRLGIYDVHRVDRVRVEELPEYIENPRTFADVGMNGKQGEVDAAGRPGEIEIEAGDARRGILDRTLERFRRSRPAVDKLGMPSDAALLHDSRLSPCSNLEEALSAARVKPPDALLVSENVNLSDVQNLKRNIDFISLAVVMVGPKVDPSVFRYGIDDWIDGVTRANLERVASRSRQMRELWNQANRDALTGCYRRDFFDPWVESQRAGYSLAICDLDDFKAVNDRHGHLLGDAVLSEFGRFLLAAVRQADIVARFGGEEFVLAFPGLPPETAVKIVRGMQDRWNRQTVEGVAVTFSCGVADSLDNADKALYSAKRTGKNRVVCKTVSERPTLCVCFGRQTDDIAMALQGAVSIVARSATFDELVVEERPDKFLFCGYHSPEWAKGVQALVDLYPESEMVVVFASKPSEEVRDVLAGCATIHVSTKFDQDALIYWLGLDDSIIRSRSEEKGSTDDRLPEIEPTAGEDHTPQKQDATEGATFVGTRLPMFSRAEEPEEPEEPNESKTAEIPSPDKQRRSGRSSWFALPKLGKARMPHSVTSTGLKSSVSLVAVWNPTGQHITRASLGLALGASGSGRDTILANLNFASPELDYWFGVSHEGECTPADVGLVTMGDELTVDMVLPMVKRSKPMGIRYLPVGYKLGHIGVPELPQHILEAALDELVPEADLVVVSPCAQHDSSATVVALSCADMVVIPFATSQELDLAKRQVSELSRAGVLDAGKVVELYWETGGAKSPKQCFDRRVRVAERMIGEGFSDDEVHAWQAVIRGLFAG